MHSSNEERKFECAGHDNEPLGGSGVYLEQLNKCLKELDSLALLTPERAKRKLISKIKKGLTSL